MRRHPEPWPNPEVDQSPRHRLRFKRQLQHEEGRPHWPGSYGHRSWKGDTTDFIDFITRLSYIVDQNLLRMHCFYQRKGAH